MWALVGVGAAVAVLVAAALLLWRRRHLRKQQPQQLIGVKVKDSEGESSGYASQPPLHCSNGINGGSLASPGSSSIYEQLQGGQASVPEGPWKIRWAGGCMVESVGSWLPGASRRMPQLSAAPPPPPTHHHHHHTYTHTVAHPPQPPLGTRL